MSEAVEASLQRLDATFRLGGSPRRQEPASHWLTRLYLRMSTRWLLVLSTLLCAAASELTAVVLLWFMFGRDAFSDPIYYLLAAVIPAVVTPPLFFSIVQLIQSVQAVSDKYQRLAAHDSLTGVLNRTGLFDRISVIPTRWTVALADLDDFKSINDEWGHHMGDLALRAISDRLTEMAGPDGLVARTGGDEFAVIVPRSSSVRVPPRLQVGVAGYVWARASLGTFTATMDTPIDEALVAADAAMYENKRRQLAELTGLDGKRRVVHLDLPGQERVKRPDLKRPDIKRMDWPNRPPYPRRASS